MKSGGATSLIMGVVVGIVSSWIFHYALDEIRQMRGEPDVSESFVRNSLFVDKTLKEADFSVGIYGELDTLLLIYGDINIYSVLIDSISDSVLGFSFAFDSPFQGIGSVDYSEGLIAGYSLYAYFDASLLDDLVPTYKARIFHDNGLTLVYDELKDTVLVIGNRQ